jgi:hypothetical protein
MGVIRDTLSGIGYALDTPGAYTRGVLSWRPGARVGGRELLENWGVLGANTPGLDMGDVAGFGAEMLLDPINLIGGSVLKGLTSANKAIRAGNKLVRAGNETVRASNKSSRVLRAAGAMPAEIVPNLHPSVIDSATGLPKRFYHGTPQAFEQYNPRMLKGDSLYGPGIYLTDAPHVASSYANKLGEVSSVSPSDLVRVNRLKELRSRVLSRSNRIYSEYKKIAADARKNVGDTTVDSTLAIRKRKANQALSKNERLLQRIDKARSSIETGTFLHPQNVRMHYVDVRKPFDVEASHLASELPDTMQGAVAGYREKAIKDLQAFDDNRWASKLPDSYREPFALAAEAKQIPGGHLLNWLGDNRSSMKTKELADAGYDALTHLGGQRIGGLGDHNVVVAFDPSQVYAPYIAPAIQAEQSLTPLRSGTAPLLAGLVGHNAAARFMAPPANYAAELPMVPYEELMQAAARPRSHKGVIAGALAGHNALRAYQ